MPLEFIDCPCSEAVVKLSQLKIKVELESFDPLVHKLFYLLK
jgi:hypothetical protein